MTKLDAGLMKSLPASDSGSSAVWGSKRINPRPQSCLCLTWSGYPSNDDDAASHPQLVFNLLPREQNPFTVFSSSHITFGCTSTAPFVTLSHLLQKKNCATLGVTFFNIQILFVYIKCDKTTNGAVEVQPKVMCDELETVKGFCYLGKRLNASGGCEAAVTAKQEWDGRNSESVVRYYLEKDSLCGQKQRYIKAM